MLHRECLVILFIEWWQEGYLIYLVEQAKANSIYKNANRTPEAIQSTWLAPITGENRDCQLKKLAFQISYAASVLTEGEQAIRIIKKQSMQNFVKGIFEQVWFQTIGKFIFPVPAWITFLN